MEGGKGVRLGRDQLGDAVVRAQLVPQSREAPVLQSCAEWGQGKQVFITLNQPALGEGSDLGVGNSPQLREFPARAAS